MPDISLLQSDYEVAVKESKIPSYFLTASIVILILSGGSYAGLFFYNKTLKTSLDQLNESIKSLNIDSASTQVGKLHQIDAQLAAIQRLRSGHTDAAKIMNAVAKSVHPNVYYEKGDFDLKKNIVDLGGVAGNPTSLASQVGIYTNSKEISEYKVSNVSLNSSDGSVKFSAVLNIKL